MFCKIRITHTYLFIINNYIKNIYIENYTILKVYNSLKIYTKYYLFVEKIF